MFIWIIFKVSVGLDIVIIRIWLYTCIYLRIFSRSRHRPHKLIYMWKLDTLFFSYFCIVSAYLWTHVSFNSRPFRYPLKVSDKIYRTGTYTRPHSQRVTSHIIWHCKHRHVCLFAWQTTTTALLIPSSVEQCLHIGLYLTCVKSAIKIRSQQEKQGVCSVICQHC